MLVVDPKEARAEGTKEPFVTGTDEEVGVELADVHGNRAAALADVEEKEGALGVAGFGNASSVEQRAVVVANMADGYEARFRSECGDDVVGGEEAIAGRDDLELDAFALLHGQPSGVLEREFAVSSDDFVAGIPLHAMCDCDGAG